MKYYRLMAKLLSPVMIRRNRQSNVLKSLDYMSGSTLRGALASTFLRKGGKPEESAFQELFLHDPVCFPCLYPSEEKTISQVLPITSYSCKRNPGFSASEKHGVLDLLAAKYVSYELKKDIDFLECPFCKESMKAFTGYWNGSMDQAHFFQPVKSYHRHTGIDRVTGTIAESIFYTTEVMSDYYKDSKDDDYCQQHLSAGIYLNDKQLEILKPLMETPVFMGAERTRGLGEVQLSISDSEIASPSFNLEEWDRGFRQKIGTYVSDEPGQGLFFTINLASHTILTDPFLRPAYELELSFHGVVPVTRVAASETVRGWHSSWGLPKPDDLALSMGSVFLFQYRGENPEGLKEYLKELIIKGIGLRREEGFGRVSVCEPLHTKEEVI